MKKLIVAIAAMLCISTTGYSKIELGLNGGVLVNTAPWTDAYKTSLFNQSSKPSPYASIKVMASLLHWQVGVGVDMATLKGKFDGAAGPITFSGESQIGKPNIPVYAFLNRTFGLPKGYLYGGVNAGISLITGNGNGLSSFNVEPTKSTGIQAGVQVGYTQWLIKGLGVNGEIGGRYLTVKSDDTVVPEETYSTFYFPISIGLRYKL